MLTVELSCELGFEHRQELTRIERLQQQPKHTKIARDLLQVSFAPARDEYRRWALGAGLHRAEKLYAAHARQSDVGDQHVDAATGREARNCSAVGLRSVR